MNSDSLPGIDHFPKTVLWVSNNDIYTCPNNKFPCPLITTHWNILNSKIDAKKIDYEIVDMRFFSDFIFKHRYEWGTLIDRRKMFKLYFFNFIGKVPSKSISGGTEQKRVEKLPKMSNFSVCIESSQEFTPDVGFHTTSYLSSIAYLLQFNLC